MTYVAKAPLVIVRGESGADVYVYAGFPLPSGVDKDVLKDLAAQDLITEDVTEASQPEAPIESTPEEVERPAESGPGSAKDKWLAFASSKGVDVDPESEKNDIIAAVVAAGH